MAPLQYVPISSYELESLIKRSVSSLQYATADYPQLVVKYRQVNTWVITFGFYTQHRKHLITDASNNTTMYRQLTAICSYCSSTTTRMAT